MRSVSQDSIEEIIKNQNILIARHAVNEIKLHLEIPNTILKILRDLDEVKEMNPLVQKEVFDRVMMQHQGIFHRIYSIDKTGREISSSDTVISEKYYNSEEFFLSALRNDSTHISSLKFNTMKKPYIITAHSISLSNKKVGVLAAEINVSAIWDLVEEIAIGERGSAFIVDGSGRLIAHSDESKAVKNINDIQKSVVKEIMEVHEISQVYTAPDGIIQLGTFIHIKDLDWIIAIQQPVDEAYAVASNILYDVLAFVVLVILVAILLASLLEKRITEPIKALIRGVKRYAEGDLDYRIQIERYEEIALLADEFNSMASSLLENQRKLRSVERLAAMSKFATLVSHEIRNPLNSMNINMQILKREIEKPGGDAEKKKKYLNIITSEINRMENLIKNFLMVARPPRFDFVLNDVHGILEEVILLHGENSRQQNVSIVKDFFNGKTIANVDRDQMKQVFHNVIINALQAMPDGGSIKIQTCLKKIDKNLDQNVQFLRIKFIDTGIGIPEDKLNNIFEVYFTMKKTGTGLGLAIARQIVEGHYGAIDVKSKLGEGTTVTVSIPTNSGLDTLS